MFRRTHRASQSASTSTSASTARAVEELEERRMFAVSVVPVWPNTLVLTGNAANDVVVINDNGNGVVTGAATNLIGGMTPFGFGGIRNIIVRTNDGNDLVRYNLNGDNLAGGATRLDVRLGNGNDTFDMYAGNDIDMGPNAYHSVNVLGEKGKDYLRAFYRGENDGQMRLVLDGGEEDDRLYTDYRFDLGSTGKFFARSLGQRGNDTMHLLVRKAFPFVPVAIDALGSGGGDIDKLTRTPWAANDATCEFVWVVP
jgi:hypothetical protein